MVSAWMGKGSVMPWAARAATRGAETPRPRTLRSTVSLSSSDGTSSGRGAFRRESATVRPARTMRTTRSDRPAVQGAAERFRTLSVPARPGRPAVAASSRMRRVLVVEDEVTLADGGRDRPARRGLRRRRRRRRAPTASGGPGRAAYDAIILDILLPGMNGYKVCGTLRDEGVWTPILMLTAKDGEYDEAEALDTGADDFLSKPFSFVVLVARLRALLRRGCTPRGRPCSRSARLDARPGVAAAAGAASATSISPRASSRCSSCLMRDRTAIVRRRRSCSTRCGARLRGRPEHRRGLRRLPAQEDRRAVRRADHPHRARRGLPARARCVDPSDRGRRAAEAALVAADGPRSA